MAEGLVLGYDASGNLVGIAIDSTSKKVQLRELTPSKLPTEIQTITAYKGKYKSLIIGSILVVFAIRLNWGVLTLFGQKSAERAEHRPVGILFLMGYVALRVKSHAVGVFFVALISRSLGTVFPDRDITLLGIGSHRNPLFHRSLSFFVLALFIGRRAGFLATQVICGGT